MDATILLVEPDGQTRTLLVEVLQVAGYSVTAATCGDEALKLLQQGCWDIVLTELELPDTSSVALLAATSHSKNCPALIIQSGCDSFEAVLNALRAGAVDYLLKPYAPTTLLACIETVTAQRRQEQQRQAAVTTIATALDQLREQEQYSIEGQSELGALSTAWHQASGQAVLRVGQLQIDRLRHEVRWADTRIPATPIQFKLLCCLAERAGQMVPGADIVEYTHGLKVSNDEAQLLLKSHVRNLRRQIDPAYLRNLRSYGYCLAAPEVQQPSLIGTDVLLEPAFQVREVAA